MSAAAAGAGCGSWSGWSRRLVAGSLRLGSGGGVGGVLGVPELTLFAVVVLDGGVRNMAKAVLAALSRSLYTSASLSLSLSAAAAARSRGRVTAHSGHRQSRSRSDGWLHTQHRLSAAGSVGVGRIMSAQCSQSCSLLVLEVVRHIRHVCCVGGVVVGAVVLGGTVGVVGWWAVSMCGS